MDSFNNILPSATIIRVRRKRTAEPLTGLIVSTKRTRTDPDPTNDARSTESLFYRLAGTGNVPSECNELLNREKIVDMLDYDIEKQVPTNKEVVVLDENYRKLMEAVHSVKTMEISDPSASEGIKEGPSEDLKHADVEMEATNAMAPLAEPEDDSEYVYDFYWANKSQVLPADDVNVRLPTDDELKLYFGFEDIDESDGDAADGDSDSNDENYYKNDYPDEGPFNGENENDTTSDDSYDHYGDRDEVYGGVGYESSED